MLYLRNDAIGTDSIVSLTQIPSVAGVKWATPNAMNLAKAIQQANPDVIWVGGLAETWAPALRSEEHTSELQSLMRISYAVFCLKKKNGQHDNQQQNNANQMTILNTNILSIRT